LRKRTPQSYIQKPSLSAHVYLLHFTNNLTMSTNKFAHWNMFPFMTTPRTKYYSGQRQSPFFRLPREIRDVIYDYSVREPDGYFYDAETGKMLYQHPSIKPKQVVRLGLMITCRIAAEEMKNIALPKIHFTTRSKFDDQPGYLGLQSRAARFKCRESYALLNHWPLQI
jgi:hypothetical protein